MTAQTPDKQAEIPVPKPRKRHKGLRKALKITLWVIMAIVLFNIGILMGVFNILTPDRLTPLTERIATQALRNVDVKIDKVELSIMKTFPFVHADIRNLVVLSTITDSLDEETRSYLPAYTDTVLAVRGFSGGLNVMKLFAKQFDLSEVKIEHPSANLVVIDDETTNFDIIPPSDKKEIEKPFDWNELAGFSLKRFTIVDPGKIRYYNNETGTELAAAFSRIDLNGTKAPLYTLNFDGAVEAPSEFLELFNIPDLRFGLNGSMTWSQSNPTALQLENFDFLFSVFGGRINTTLNFASGLTIERIDLAMNPLGVHQLLSMVPEDIAAEFGIPSADAMDTDAVIKLAVKTDSPWNIGGDTIPMMTISADIPACSFAGYGAQAENLAAHVDLTVTKPWDMTNSLPDLKATIRINPMTVKWQEMDLRKFAADITATLPDGDLYGATVKVNNLVMQGPATDLTVTGTITHLTDDPLFDLNVDGHTDIRKLPAVIRNAIDGTLGGSLTARVGLRGSPSMFTPNTFHRLAMNGDVTLRDFYWISGDTVNMVDVDRASFHFGTSEGFSHEGMKVDSLLRVSLDVDSVAIVHSDLSMNVRKFRISLASQNKSGSARRDKINPMGGHLSVGAFNLTKVTDSTVVRIRDVNGYTVIKPYNNDLRTPQFLFDLDVRRLATGNSDTRFVINNLHTNLNARKVAKGKSAKRFTHIADSIHYAHPDLQPDSVLKYALAIHQRHRGRYPRVHPKYQAADSLDIIDWGATPLFKKMLTLWTFEGTVKSRRAGLFTPYLPLRNRVRDIDIAFNNDSLNITNLQYKIGHSDMTINGVVSNMRRAFTSTSGRQALKLNFDVVSDTIDVNQLSDAFMAGAAYAAKPKTGHKFDFGQLDEDEDAMEHKIARMTQNNPDTVMPLLIPENIDAELNLRSNHVRYSDFMLRNMTGRILTYNGAVNLQNLSAASEVGSLNISALYTGLHPEDLRFGFGLQLKDFNIHRFLRLVPAVDSLLPVMRDFSGIVSADIAATSDVDNKMNLVIPTLDAAIGIRGDSLVLIDPDTFKSLSKWLLFKDKNRNIIDHMDVQMVVKNSQVDVYPFIFDIDRYKIGVQGFNDFNMNFDYHIAVLKSPIPFKFGINISGNPDKYKIRLGGAKFGEKQLREVSIVDTTRVNLMNEIREVFRRGARDARLARLKVNNRPLAANINLASDSLTHADSLRFIEEGLIEPNPAIMDPGADKKKARRNAKTKTGSSDKVTEASSLLLPMAAIAAGRNTRRRRKND